MQGEKLSQERSQIVSVNFGMILIGQFQREDVLEAHCCQYGALYNFGISYEVKSDGSKTSAGVRDFYDFLSKYVLQCISYHASP